MEEFGGESDKDPEVKEENFGLPREGLRGREQNVSKGVDGKGHSDEVSDRNERCAIRLWKKGNFLSYSGRELG